MSRHGLPTKLFARGAQLRNGHGEAFVVVLHGTTSRAEQLATELAEAYNGHNPMKDSLEELTSVLELEQKEHHTTRGLIKEFLASLNNPNDSPERIAAYAALTKHLETP